MLAWEGCHERCARCIRRECRRSTDARRPAVEVDPEGKLFVFLSYLNSTLFVFCSCPCFLFETTGQGYLFLLISYVPKTFKSPKSAPGGGNSSTFLLTPSAACTAPIFHGYGSSKVYFQCFILHFPWPTTAGLNDRHEENIHVQAFIQLVGLCICTDAKMIDNILVPYTYIFLIGRLPDTYRYIPE